MTAIFKQKPYELIAYAFITLIAGWLISSAALIHIEPDDGLSTIVNSKHLIGLTAENLFFMQRGPLVALLLTPAAWFSEALGLAPLDFRLYHGTFALLNIYYLVAIWRVLTLLFPEKSVVTLITFVSSITTFIFFSYSPFISHDIFPGILLLWMLLLSHKYCESPKPRTLVMLVLFGAAAPLIKQTYATFWVVVLLSRLLFSLTLPKPEQRLQVKLTGNLFIAACVSAVITWIGYCWSLGHVIGEITFLLRPIEQIQSVSNHYEGEALSDLFPWWLYLVNLHAYGFLTMAFVLPGLYFSLKKGSNFQKQAAIVWLLSFLAMSAITFKEVRYMAFLAPISAIVIYPAIRYVSELRPLWLGIIVTILSLDVARSGKEASAVYGDFYRHEFERQFSLLKHPEFSGTVVLSPVFVTLLYPEYSPLFADRYHRLFHVNGVQLKGMFHQLVHKQQAIELGIQKFLNNSNLEPGDVYLFANGSGTRNPPWTLDNGVDFHNEGYLSGAALVKKVVLVKAGRNYIRQDGGNQNQKPLMLVKSPEGKAEQVIILSTLPIAVAKDLYGYEEAQATLEVNAFEVEILCNKDSCQYYKTENPQ